MTGADLDRAETAGRPWGGLCCPSCRGPLTWAAGGQGGRCVPCDRPFSVRGGRIADFEAGWTAAADDILGWPADFADRLCGPLLDIRAGRAVDEGVVAELAARELVVPGRGLTAAGRTVAYHTDEGRRREGCDEINAFCDLAGAGPGSEILDVGCGAGQTLLALDGRGFQGRVGVDINPEALALGARLVGPDRPALRLVRATADALPFPEGSFTHVVSRVALNYMRQGPALAEMVRVLRPGGYLYCRVEGPGFDLRLLRERRGGNRRALGHLRNLFWGAVLEVVGWQPAPGRRVVSWDRAFATSRRLGRSLRAGCETPKVRVTGRYLGLPLGAEVVARKRP